MSGEEVSGQENACPDAGSRFMLGIDNPSSGQYDCERETCEMVQAGLRAGDFLIFQLESGYALMRLLELDEAAGVWHVAVYGDFYPDISFAEGAITDPASISVNSPHLALTTRAFESTQVAAIGNVALNEAELAPLVAWYTDPDRVVSDRSVRLMLGIR